MPFGLCNAPTTFERLVKRVLNGRPLYTSMMYGPTFKELERLEVILQWLRQGGLKFTPKKCPLFQQKMPFLGHVVSSQGVRKDPEKVEAVQEWPEPKKLAELQRFL